MTMLPQIMSQLESLPIRYGLKFNGDSAWIRCPNHKDGNERTPSLKINLSQKAALGSFYCFSCLFSGSWDKLAKVLSLSRIPYNENAIDIDPSIDKELLGTQETVIKQGMEWPKNLEWRGIPGSLINKIGGTHYFDFTTQQANLLLPVNVQNKIIGGIRCLLEPNDKFPKYRNTPGNWIKRALFPFDHVAKMKPKTVVLVEGPRDSLNLLSANIPALSNLGAKNSWSKSKLGLLLELDLETVILAFDPDKPGQLAARAVKKDLQGWINTRKLVLPQGCDPGSLDKNQLVKLGRLV